MLHQLGNATVVMGDDTWLQLFPPSSGVLAAAHPYPSLVVRDLHTVDDGVWTVRGRAHINTAPYDPCLVAYHTIVVPYHECLAMH